jgi:hypothetical protein
METVDDETGQAKSIVEIYEKSGKIYGKVEIFDAEHKRFMQELLGRRCK